MLVSTLYRNEGSPYVNSEKSFEDLPQNAYYTNAALWAVENGLLYANCGSVGLPKDNSPHSCMVVTEAEIRWIDIVEGTVFHTQKL